jgi:hypothetical protein
MARVRLAVPSPCPEKFADHRRQPARSSDWAPSEANGLEGVGSRVQISLEVRPLVTGPLVTEPAIELDDQQVAWVENIAEPGHLLDLEPRLSLRPGQAMGPFDLGEVAMLEQREGPCGHVVQDRTDERSTRKTRVSVQRVK